MKRIFRLFDRQTSGSGKTVAFDLGDANEHQVTVRFTSDNDVIVQAMDCDGTIHPLIITKSYDQVMNFEGARQLILTPTDKRQNISFDVRIRETYGGSELLDLTPIEIKTPFENPGLSISQMVLAELRRYGVGRDENEDEDDDDLEFEEDHTDFGTGYMEPEEDLRVPPKPEPEPPQPTAAKEEEDTEPSEAPAPPPG